MATVTENLDDARTLRLLVEAVAADDDHDTDQLVLILLDSLIRDNEFTLGIIPSPYCDNLQRRIVLRQILQTADKIYDALAEAFDGEALPPAAAGLCRFIAVETFPLVQLIQAIEAEFPQLAESFANDREQYAVTRTGAEHAA